MQVKMKTEDFTVLINGEKVYAIKEGELAEGELDRILAEQRAKDLGELIAKWQKAGCDEQQEPESLREILESIRDKIAKTELKNRCENQVEFLLFLDNQFKALKPKIKAWAKECVPKRNGFYPQIAEEGYLFIIDQILANIDKAE